MTNVVIAWDAMENKSIQDAFEKSMLRIFSSVRTEKFQTDEEHIFYTQKSDLLEKAISERICDFLLINEKFDGKNIGTGSLKRWINTNPDMRIILVIGDEKKSTAKLNVLHKNGYYDCIYRQNFTPRYVAKLVAQSRTKDDAYLYYDLDNYVESNIKENKNIKKGAVKTEDAEINIVSDDNKKELESTKEVPSKKNKISTNDLVNKGIIDVKKGQEKTYEVKKIEKSDIQSNKEQIKVDNSKNSDNDGHKEKESRKKNKEESKKIESLSVRKKSEKKSEKTKDVNKKSLEKHLVKFEDEDTHNRLESHKNTTLSSKKENISTAAVPKKKKVPSPLIAFGAEPQDEKLEQKKERKYIREEQDTYEAFNSVESLSDSDVEFDTSEIDNIEDQNEEKKENPYDTIDLLIPSDDGYKEPDTNKVLAKSQDELLEYIAQSEKRAMKTIEPDFELNAEDMVLEAVMHHYTSEDPTLLSNMESNLTSREDFEDDCWKLISNISMANELSNEEANRVFERFMDFMWNYDILIPFINDPSISDISISSPTSIEVKKNGNRYLSKIPFRSREHYEAFVTHLAKRNHILMTDDAPEKTFMDTTTSNAARLRIVLSTAYVNSSRMPAIDIRKVPNSKYKIQELINAKMMSPRTAALLINKVRSGYGFIFTGGMASGKTTIMNTLIDYIPHNKRILSIQENEEMFSDVHPNAIFQRLAQSPDGTQIFDLRYLSTFALLLDVDYFAIGEIKGAEAKQFVDADFSNTITWSTVHSPSSKDALPRIADLAKLGDSDYSIESLLKRLSSSKKLVVFMENFKVKEISEVIEYDKERNEVLYRNIQLD